MTKDSSKFLETSLKLIYDSIQLEDTFQWITRSLLEDFNKIIKLEIAFSVIIQIVVNADFAVIIYVRAVLSRIIMGSSSNTA